MESLLICVPNGVLTSLMIKILYMIIILEIATLDTNRFLPWCRLLIVSLTTVFNCSLSWSLFEAYISGSLPDGMAGHVRIGMK